MALIHENGAFNETAISAEIERQLADMSRSWADWSPERRAAQVEMYRGIIREWIERDARIERHEHFEAAYRALMTDAERAKLAELDDLARWQPISFNGNAAYREINGEADKIRSAIRARVEAHFERLSAPSLFAEVRAAARARASVSVN